MNITGGPKFALLRMDVGYFLVSEREKRSLSCLICGIHALGPYYGLFVLCFLGVFSGGGGETSLISWLDLNALCS